MIDVFSYQLIAQAVGIIASALIILSFTQKNDVKFKLIVMCGAFVFAIHFYMLGAYLGAAVAILNVLRTGLSIRFYQSNYLLVIFILLYLIVGIFTYGNFYDALPLFSSIASTYALYKFSGLRLRYLFFFTEGAWLLYSIFIKSLGGIITNIFVLCANAITSYRLSKDNKNDQNTPG